MNSFLCRATAFLGEEPAHEHESLFASVKENISFILVALLISAAIIGLTVFMERALFKKSDSIEKGFSAKKIVGIGVFSTIGTVLALIEIPLFTQFYFLDFSEVAGMIAAFLLGPVAGVLVEFIKTILHILIHGTHSVFVGDFAAFIMGSVFILPVSVIYLRNKTRKNALIGLCVSTLTLILVGGLFNGFYLIPKFASLYGMDIEGIVAVAAENNSAINSVWTIVAFATVPFNLVKGITVSVVVFLIYHPLARLYRRIG